MFDAFYPPIHSIAEEDNDTTTIDSDDYPTLDDVFDNIESDETGLH